ncbi:MAG TPA: hypothetical protein VFR09_09190 [Alphaproteobacteria bacterium]|nr:hypothetical protein [Alphaproteobacteria bacterium]
MSEPALKREPTHLRVVDTSPINEAASETPKAKPKRGIAVFFGSAAAAAAAICVGITAYNDSVTKHKGEIALPLASEVDPDHTKLCTDLPKVSLALARARLEATSHPEWIYCKRNGGRVKLKPSTYLSEYTKH